MKKTVLSLLLLLLVQPWALQAKNFRVLSFNIRLLTGVDSINIWDNRKDALCRYVDNLAPDVFGMQEVTHVQLTDILSSLPDYDYVGVGRDDGKTGGEYSPVFFRKDRYKVLRSGTFWLSDTPEEVSYGWDANCRRVCSWALLQDIKSGKNFIFANTHLDHIGQQARANGAKLIKERLSRIANNIPLVVTGDFNVTDANPAYSTMVQGIFPMSDAWKAAKKRVGPKGTFHDYGRIAPDKRDKIDFIFVTPNVKVLKAVIEDDHVGNGLYLSDHNPHYADLSHKDF